VQIDPSLQALIDSVVALTEYASEHRHVEEPTREETEEALLLARRTLETVLSYLPQEVRPQPVPPQQVRPPQHVEPQHVQPQHAQPQHVQPQPVRTQEKPPGASAADQPGKGDGAGSHQGTAASHSAKPQAFLVVPQTHRHRRRSRSRSMIEGCGQPWDPVFRALRRPRTSSMMSYHSKRFWTWVSLTVLFDLLQYSMTPPQVAWRAGLSLVSGMVAFGSLIALPMVLIAVRSDSSRSVPEKVVRLLLSLVGLSATACAAGAVVWWTHTAQ